MVRFDEKGREIPDPTPMAHHMPAGAYAPESLQSMMRRMIRETLSAQAAAEGEETFEEANDFDLEDEDFDDPLTAYETMGAEADDIDADGPELTTAGSNGGSAEPAGLRPGGADPSNGAGGPETDAVDGEPVRDPADSLRSTAGETNLAADSARASIRGRSRGQSRGG